ncbi:MAG: DUF1987 domain-containing protein [Pseudomonadota bacterium]
MENLTIEATKSTPSIVFDAQSGVLEIRGKSYPENAAKFFAPVFEWVNSYLRSADPATVRLILEIIYLNSSSSKALLNLLDLLDRSAKGGREVVIDWLYHEEDETSLECGEEFKEDLESAVFNLVAIPEE